MALNIIHNCRCDACLSVDPNGRTHVFSDSPNPVVLTGSISGLVQLPDGSQVDVSPVAVESESEEHAAAIREAIGKHYQKHGHPDHYEIDPKTGDRVQKKFTYDDSNDKHGRRAGKKG